MKDTVPEAASVLLARGVGSAEVFLVRRADNLRFFGGFYAFPGGRVDAADATLAPDLTGAQAAAVRELFEETGVLLARRTDGSFPAASDDLTGARRDLLEGRITFAELLERRGLSIQVGDLANAGSLVTPSFSPIRFNTRFFVAVLPAGQATDVWPGELVHGEWHCASAVLASWERGERLLSPPTVTLLKAIHGRPVAALGEQLRPELERLARAELPGIAFAPDVDMLPLHCAGLGPSTHTNAFLIGRDPAWLLDPGPTDPDEQQRLFVALDRAQETGRRLAGIVLTHHHPDHIGAAAACAERYRLPIVAHAETARLLVGKVPVTRQLADGERLDLGSATDDKPWWLEAIHTPGHAPGHLVFYDPHYRLLFAGDMVSTLSSVVIAPPEGNLAAYLDSLRRLQALPARLLLPAHGGPTSRVQIALESCLEHRRQREEQLVAALGTSPKTATELCQEMYRGLPNNLLHLAELQTLAGLKKLEQEARATCEDAGWRIGK